MRVALTVFDSTISPLFDAARRLMVVDVHDGDSQVRSEEEIGGLDLAQRIALLTTLRVRVLACGAISEFSENALLERGIEVYPWVSGDIHDVLDILARRCGTVARSTKLAIPTTGPHLGALVAPTFRRCSHLLIVETPDRKRTVTRVIDGFAGGGGCYNLARLIVEAEARVLLTGRCGPNAMGILTIAGVEVIQGVEGPVTKAIDAYIRDSPGSRVSEVTPANSSRRGPWSTRGRGWRGAGTRGEWPGGGGQGGRGRSRRNVRGRNRAQCAPAADREREQRGQGPRAVHLGMGPSTGGQARRPVFQGLVPVVDEEKCSGCSTCELVCPNGAISIEEGIARIDSDKCIRGGMCVEVCPEHALDMSPTMNTKEKDNARI